MKVKLFVLAALVLLSSINSIFNNIPIVGVSAQQYEEIDDNGSNGNNNGMAESYSYDDSATYNTGDGYNNNYDPSMEEQDSEYSTYNNGYGPATYGTGEEEEYSSYDNYDNYEYLYSEYLQDDYSSDSSISYEKDGNDYSYDKNYYPPKEPETFTCPGSGLVVDKQENCPVVCPAGTDLAGHLVKAGSDLQNVCNENAQELEICGPSTDLAGVYVSNAPADCNIFATCSAIDPLGQALGLTGTQTVEVADPQLCQLAVPSEFVLEQCTTGPMTGALVTDELLCQAPNDANICADGTDLEGVYVTDPTTECEIDYPTCDATDPLGQALGLTGTQTVEVVDAQLCNLDVPEEVTLTECTTGPMTGALVTDELLCQAPNDANICADGTDLEGVYVTDPTTECEIDYPTCDATDPLGQALGLTGTQTVEVVDAQLCNLDVPEEVTLTECTTGPMTGALVTDELLCQAPNDANICADGTDLEGVYVTDPTTECDIDIDIAITTNPEAQCVKCGDLAVFQALSVMGSGANQNFPQREASTDLIGTAGGDNIFTVCEDADTVDPTTEFNALVDITDNTQEGLIETAFNNCVDRAPDADASLLQAQAQSLQESSITTNVQPESEIPTFSPMITGFSGLSP